MSEVVHGHFEPLRSDLRFYSATAPFVASKVIHGGQLLDIDFLVDTEADSSILSPQDAASLFGIEQYEALFQHEPVISVAGVGRGVGVQQFVQLLLFDVVGGSISFNHVMTVMGLALDQEGQPTNWSMPSLLGRDVLEQFCLHLCYRPPSLELEYIGPPGS